MINSKARNIQTTYYLQKEVVKINRAVHANSAVLRCVDHMQLNNYGATHAEVFDEGSGVLHAVVRYVLATSTIAIVFKRPVEKEN